MNSTSPAPLARILVVDDHGIVREAISALLQRESRWNVVGLAATGEQAVLAAEHLRPDLIIMDLILPALNGIDATKRILNSLPLTKIIILSATSTPEHFHRALRAGARGCVMKNAAGSALVCAVQAVLSGERYLSPSVRAALELGSVEEAAARNPMECLSPREREILHRTVEGYSSTEIALQLSLSRNTVDTYRSRLMQKLGVDNRSTLIRFAIQHAMAPC